MKMEHFSNLPLLLTSYYLKWYYPFVSLLLFFAVIIRLFVGFIRSLDISSVGKGVLITGCDTGFGHQLAINLSKAGFTVFACCLDDQSEGGMRLSSLDTNIAKIHVIKMDVTKQQQVDDALNYVEKHLPKSGLWGLVNNAGVGGIGFVEWVSLDQFEKMAAVNLFGAIRVTKAFAPLIRKSKGRIVNVSSILGRATNRYLSAYCITKHGMEAFSNVLRKEMKQFQVKVCTIEPGNFLNLTGIIGGIEGAVRIVDQNWNNLSESLKESYGRQSVEDCIVLNKWKFNTSEKDITPVVNAMTDCVGRLYPKTHYIVGSLYDKTFVHLYELLPTYLMDPLVSFGLNSVIALHKLL